MKNNTYSVVRSGIIKLTPDGVKCKLYCKGLQCKYCNSDNWKENETDIKGIYSNWITKNIIGMARPTEEAITKYKIIEQFKEKNIRTLINLQIINEHSNCGPFLKSSGFSYDPEQFMSAGIYYYNFPIPDYEICTIKFIRSIMKVIHFSLNEGNIAIHCHAGLGRTGTIIAAYFIWHDKLSYFKAIQIVRKNRPRSIQSKIQVEFLKQFDDYCHKYGVLIPKINKKSFSWFMENQRLSLPTIQCQKYGHIFKSVHEICKKLLKEIFQDEFSFEKVDNDNFYCIIGKLKVNWTPALTNHGKSVTTFIVNVMESMELIFQDNETYEIIKKAQKNNIITFEKDLHLYNTRELLIILVAQMKLIKTPIASKEELISIFTRNDTSQICAFKTNNSCYPWICFVQYLCQVFSVIMNEYYSSFVSILTVWLFGEEDEEVRYAIFTYMRDLFADHFKEQKMIENTINKIGNI
ncbi:Protein-tyrosine phosphatase,receptor/non-receptor type domain and Dual specificity phosphatase, catalytic domain and Protein-tyrosine/Dual specificity phosphatase domain and Protein-tyrosine phosphatase, catalytic domain and Dual specificity phosphatase, subgroup, catalytic domain-containing protein [Strongyloides ratti]|uniref:TYR_PHOSPHATASE_2 domain-containing protein n=1 Tax=Strongyloides ratti TaxID=34506 RepID=A0A090KT35_STRRB|nr:Protein-tyrosine phosphatase,receptor/non-receptor type domain and Dual specificity phosphatase, catalytic domain and Protein-tyrosine/Dual specificity phosphatase domain and Protein-tyrosine phosphatase, catalytic domain and Dual specificity phosphatase, subgroup, catalytic domain-containing protein [Strongyloides ratti]CEF60571.1 Protein-tyrosine phosphatase,receptor/non-receptor type domain and Dual specificity phosphatase, catalytic domain and Protein-tyrosine/Dual specificity phosphatase d